MMINGHYWSVFLTEERPVQEKLSWIRAYTQYLSESPDRPGWCQKKADDDWEKFQQLINPSIH